ncbi:hypothetical protein [Inquilinus limosus]|uniref:Uncharacterized protein n=1 Tax=Inquilinus limosus TaxID=171674 RepID=A0A211Z3J3_9PROT|nr:hypothetical protein [Inquilinus limosus]OWJ59832.1 hypothetical protein BWR60_32125 [Inquilinus limosus]
MTYPGRRLPFAVEHGRAGEMPPRHVSRLSDSRIILGGVGALRLPSEIRFAGEGPVWRNDDLFAKLAALNAQDIPFAVQPREMAGPDALMAWWQETGRLAVSFRAISWTGPDRWLVTTVELPVMGLLGWTGPTPFGP